MNVKRWIFLILGGVWYTACLPSTSIIKPAQPPENKAVGWRTCHQRYYVAVEEQQTYSNRDYSTTVTSNSSEVKLFLPKCIEPLGKAELSKGAKLELKSFSHPSPKKNRRRRRRH